MRRNAVRLLKYLVVAALFLTLGPVTVKLMFGDQQHDLARKHLRREPVVAHGLPVDPDDMKAAVMYSPVSITGLSVCLAIDTQDRRLLCNGLSARRR